MSDNGIILLLSFVAGVIGTGLGGVVGAFLGSKSKKVMSRILSFAGGVMVGVVAFEMIPEAVSMSAVGDWDKSGVLIGILSLVAGISAVYVLNKVIDMIENKRSTHKTLEELHHTARILKTNEDMLIAPVDPQAAAKNKKSLLKAGMIMFAAIALHNFPEGMAIGATGVASIKTGILLACILAVHDVPEGMAIAAPLAGGGIKKWKAIGLTALAGATTVLGAIVGVLIGRLSDLATGICMGLAGGAMLYVTFCEILPQATLMEEGRVPAASMLVGVLCSMVFVYLF